MNLAGKTAVVTGGTRGIGLAIVEALAAEGANVAFCGRNESQLEDVQQSLFARWQKKFMGNTCDVRDYNQVVSFLDRVALEFDGIDILVNNAGIAIIAPIEAMQPGEWQAVIETNLTGVFNCCHVAIPHMKRRGGGHIINMASRSGKNAFAGGLAYSASKFGLVGLSEALFLDLRSANIKVSYVMPGPVSSSLVGDVHKDWQLLPTDVAKAITDILSHNSRAVASRVELRPAIQEYNV